MQSSIKNFDPLCVLTSNTKKTEMLKAIVMASQTLKNALKPFPVFAFPDAKNFTEEAIHSIPQMSELLSFKERRIKKYIITDIAPDHGHLQIKDLLPKEKTWV